MRRWFAFTLTILLAPAARAQDEAASAGATDDGAATEEELEQLRERMRALEEQLDQLRGERDAEAEVIPLDLETKVHGYADVGLVAYTQNHPPGFQVGDLLISYVANLDRKVHLTTDVVFGLEHLGDWLSMLDRLQVDFNIANGFQITAGKIQSPYGYWNTNIPSGSWLYAPYSRPFVLQYERHGAAIATRQAGVDIHGEVPFGFWRAGYHAGVGNGRAPHLVQTQDIGDGNWYKTTWVQVWIESPNGIQIGVTGAYDPIRVGKMTMDFSEDVGDQGDDVMVHQSDENPALTQNVDEYLGVGHIAWNGDRMQILAEAYFVFHRWQVADIDAKEPTEIALSRDFYVQWAHEFRPVTPYLRADYVSWNYESPVYQDLGKLKNQGVLTAGVRRDVALHAALKFEGYTQYEQKFLNPDDLPDPDLIDVPPATERLRYGGGVYLVAGF